MIHCVLAKAARRRALHLIGADYTRLTFREIGQRRASRCKDNTGSLQRLPYAGECARIRNSAADLKIADRGFAEIGLGGKSHAGPGQ